LCRCSSAVPAECSGSEALARRTARLPTIFEVSDTPCWEGQR